MAQAASFGRTQSGHERGRGEQQLKIRRRLVHLLHSAARCLNAEGTHPATVCCDQAGLHS